MTIITLIIHRFRQVRQERRERAPESVVASLPTGTWSGEGVVFDEEGKVEKETHPDTSHHESDTEVEGEGEAPPVESDGVPARPALNHEFSEASTSASSPFPSSTVVPASPVTERTEQAATLSTRSVTIVIPTPSPSSSPTVATTSNAPAGPATQRTRYLKKAWFASQTECAICLGDFEKGDKLRILPCGHLFHLDEVDVWLIRRKKLVSLSVPNPLMIPVKSRSPI